MAGKVLVVYAHPNPKSFTNAVLQAVLSGLARSHDPSEVTVLDLYADQFEPRLIVNEEIRRRDMDKVEYTQLYRDQLEAATTVVFVYPVWWGGFPAILKGYVDRVLVSGLAYSFAGRPRKAILPQGLMKGKSIHFFYTLDSPWLVAQFDPGWYSNLFSVFRYCGFSPIRRHFLARLKLTSPKKRSRWLTKVNALAAQL